MRRVEALGKVHEFPDHFSDADVAAALRLIYPARLEPGQVRVGENGSTVEHDERLDRYVVRDHAGNARGYRDKLSDALRLADGLVRPAERTLRRRYHVEAVPTSRPMPRPHQVATQVDHDVEKHIEAQEAKRHWAAVAERKTRRSRNHGTTHR